MRITDAIGRDCVRTGVSAGSRDQVLRSIAALLTESGRLPGEREQDVYAALRAREDIGSTGFGGGVAIPHCRLPGLEEFLAGMLVLEDSVDFDAVDGEPVRIVPFLVGPERQAKGHLSLLSCFAQLLRSEKVRKQLLSSSGPDEALDALLEGLPSAAPTSRSEPVRGEVRLMHVFIQDEEAFDDVLAVFAAAETFSTVVLEAHESTDYLARTPLFAGFWDSDLHTFDRVIVATVKEELVNAVIRNIEYVCGRLDEREGVMITVAPLISVTGSLGV